MPEPIIIGGIYRNIVRGVLGVFAKLEYYPDGILVIFKNAWPAYAELFEIFQKEYRLVTP